MNIISHRRNTTIELKETPHKYGIEVDVRSYGNKLVIHHDPFVEGEMFEDWLKEYQHGTLILNVKEEGLEEKLIELMRHYEIHDYFFLDQSFPFLIKYSKLGVRRCAVRVSEFESIQTVLTLAGKVDWVWVDCFTHFPLSYGDSVSLHDAAFRLCIVSPELQGRDANTEIAQLAQLLQERAIKIDAVCTKRPELWEELIGG